LSRLRCGQGRNEEGREAQLGAESLRGRRKSPNNVTSTSFNTEHLFPKDIRHEHDGTKVAYCPGRHLASLRPWVWWVLQQIISLTNPVASHR